MSIEQESVYYFLSVMAGLGIVLFAMRSLAGGFQVIFSKPIRVLMNSVSINPFVSLLVGIVNSFFIQSGYSSSIMALSYAGSGLLSLTQLILLILGSGLGTVFTVWILTLDTMGIDLYLIAIGVLPMMYAQGDFVSAIGKSIFSLGLLFFGYNLMLVTPDVKVLDLMQSNMSWMSQFSGFSIFWMLCLAVIIISIMLRSTVAIAALMMALYQKGVIPITFAVMVVVAANFGRTIPIMISSMAAGLQPKRGALSNVLVNLSGVFIFSLFFQDIYRVLNDFFMTISGGNFKPVLLIPGFHLVFNVFIVVIFFLLLVPIKWILLQLIPDTESKQPQKLKFLGRTTHLSPTLAIEQVYQEIKKMAATCQTTIELTALYLSSQENGLVEKVIKYEKVTDNIQQEIYDFLSRVMEVSLTSRQGEQVRALLRMANELESIADRCKQVLLSQKEVMQMGVTPDGPFHDQLKRIMDQLKDVYESTFWTVADQDTSAQDYKKKLVKFDQLSLELKESYMQWIRDVASTGYQEEAGLKYGDILSGVLQIRGRSQNLFEAYRYGYLQ